MLHLLNEDCLCLIMKLLDLDDQMVLAHVCQRLKMVAHGHWQSNCRKLDIGREYFNNFSTHKFYYMEYFRSISDEVETLQLTITKSLYLNTLNGIHFPKAHSLSINVIDETNCDRSIEIISRTFPNLLSLKFCGNITGAYLWNFHKLQRLNLDGCRDLLPKHLKQTFSTLHLKAFSLSYYGRNLNFLEGIDAIASCKTLEELCMDGENLIYICNEIFKLKNLRKITVAADESISDILNKITKRYGNAMESMIADCVSYPEMYSIYLKDMYKLRRLVLRKCFIGNEYLRDISVWLGRTLKEFYFLEGRCFRATNEDGLLDVVRQCTNLELYDLSGTNIDVAFVEKIKAIISKQNKKRNKTLLLRCYNTKIKHEHVQALNLPEELQICLKEKPIQCPGLGFIECEWRL